MGATKEQAELTRQRLLKAGLKVFSEKGFAATRLEDIAKEADVTRGAFYWHFKNKLELFREVFQEAVNELRFEAQAILRTDIAPYEKLRRLIMHVPTKFLTDEDFCAVGRLRYKIEWTPEAKEALAEPFQEGHSSQRKAQFFQLIEDGRQSGDFRSDLTTSAIFTMVNVFIPGLIHQVPGSLGTFQ